jgi:hypothetical protein
MAERIAIVQAREECRRVLTTVDRQALQLLAPREGRREEDDL